MKAMTTLLVGAALVLGTSGAMATALDPSLVRPVTVNGSPGAEKSLQYELDLMFGAGKLDALKDQLNTGMFQISTPSSTSINPQFKFEFTGNSSTQGVGIFGWDGSKAVEAPIFSGANAVGDYAVVSWDTSTSGTIDTKNKATNTWSSASFSGINRDFFGFYFQPVATTDPTYFSVDALNPNGLLHTAPNPARVLAYDGHKAGIANSGILFAYEDGVDFDYNDGGFFVESIAPVPEPGTMVLLGAGFLGLAIYGKRRRNA